LSREWKSEGVTDGESGELTESEEVARAGTDKSETEGLGRGGRSKFAVTWEKFTGAETRYEARQRHGRLKVDLNLKL